MWCRHQALYLYSGANPISYADPFGLLTGVTVWHPGGWGESSFGHLSVDIDINGTTYSFGPSGMTVMSTAAYNELNGFREGMELQLNLTDSQEAALQAYLSRYRVPYDPAYNNCATPVQRGLAQSGIDTGHQMLPVSLGNQLIDMGLVKGVVDHPPTRSATGSSAPWAR